MKPLVPTGIPLRGVQLIEASAGTGKTFTITTLYLRLLLERELAVPQILVVTFTRAATAELKDRVRGRISLALAALNGTPPKDDATLSAYLESRAAHRARDRHLLALALSEFDRAAISTIHGFCSRILGDRAFESRIDFSAELIEGDDIELQQLVRDWWTNILHRAPAAAVRHLQKKFTLKNLMEVAHRSTGDSDVPVEPETSLPDLSDVHMTMSQAHDTWAGLMRREGTAAHDLLVSMTGSLHQRVLSAGHVAGLFDALGHHLDRPSMEMMRNLERITVPYLTKKTVSKGTTPEHPLFSAATVLYDAVTAHEEALVTYSVAALYDLAMTCRRELPLRHAARGTLTHNLLLTRLRAALRGAQGDELATLVRAQHPAALIDEFQDTDPVQYEIFHRIYAESTSDGKVVSPPATLFQIGDPKQAIYGFRGADIFAYLRGARAAKGTGYTLRTNWRSDPRYIDALNFLYERVQAPFAFSEIAYHSVQAPVERENQLLQGAEVTSAIDILWAAIDEEAAAPLEGKGSIATDFGERELPSRIAEHILGLFRSNASIQGKPVQPNDVAILCSTNAQLESIEHALVRRGIPAVRRGVGSVHQSETARELSLLLYATLYPGDTGVVRSALVTTLLGLDANDLIDLERSPEGWNLWAERLHRAQDLWHHEGVMPMVQHLAQSTDMTARLLARMDGQRRLTDLRHLAELLHREATLKGLSPLSTLGWLDEQRREDLKSAETELRIETDDAAVQLITIHKSKGLEFPIVYLPYLFGDVRKKQHTGPCRVYHDPSADYEARILLGAGGNPTAEAQHEMEETAENLRKLYVALTRAKHRSVVVWGQFAWANKTALGQVLHAPLTGANTLASTIKDDLKDMSESERRTEIDALAQTSGGLVRISPLPRETNTVYSESRPRATPRQARSFSRHLGTPWRVTSFSGLSQRAQSKGWIESHRDMDLHLGLQEAPSIPPDGSRVIPLADFPAGPHIGNLIHEVLEHCDFESATPQTLEKLIEPRLRAANIELTHLPTLVEGLDSALDAPLGHSLGDRSLRTIPQARRIDEMEFLYPLKHGSGTDGPSLAAAFATKSKMPDYATHLQRLTPGRLRGYLRGFIDLIFEHDGRWYVADYKSNHLGGQRSDYASDHLERTMLKHDYILQYHLYAVALVRFLRLRLPHYDPEEHFGGVYYLFLRGMTRDGKDGSGIYFDRPSAALLTELDRALTPEMMA